MTATEAPPSPAALPGPEAVVATPADTLLRDLGTSRSGLSPREVEKRLLVYGRNELPRARGRGWYADLAGQFTHPLALLLWLAAALAVVAGTPVLSWAIVAVIVLNALVAFVQERQAAHAVESLAEYLPLQARVIRDGRVSTVAATDVVPGDLVLVEEGDRICADARVIDGSVEVDLSAVTGESVPVTRWADGTDGAGRLLDAADAVFSGTNCTAGEATVVVFATGRYTQLGRIAALSQRVRTESSPLERQVRGTAWLIAAVAIGIGLLFLPLGLIAGLSFADAAVFSVGLLVANVPEGLLPTITLALAVGVRVLARQGALVKRLSAVETLGSTTVICTDKTGTLTQNRMRVVESWMHEGDRSEHETGELMRALAECTDATASDPMEQAIVDFAAEHGAVGRRRIEAFRFDPRRKRMSVVVDGGPSGLQVVQVKGAPETVLPLCTRRADGVTPLTSADVDAVTRQTEDMATRGLRVLAVAQRTAAEAPSSVEDAETALCFLGLIALLDPPRPEVVAAVADCHRAGMRVHVVTGDHGSTASEIARQVGIGADRVVLGAEMDAMPDSELDRLLEEPGEIVFARSTPEGKLRIAEALRHNGEVVAMTGDGVNDAPALHHADIGIAMGKSGTDVAREAATMVLTDDNFATIVTAVREGRRAYDNLRKFVLYIFAHAVGEVVPFIVFALSAGLVPLPLTVLQILAIDLGTETLPAVALGREAAEPDVMSRAPRPRRERLITGRLLMRAWAVMGVVSAVLAMALFFAVLLVAGWRPGDPVGSGHPLHTAYLQATTATFAAIVACQVGIAFAARTEHTSLRSLGFLSNRLLLAGIAFEIAFALSLIYLPPFQSVFGTRALPWWAVLALLPMPFLAWCADALYRRRGAANYRSGLYRRGL